MRSNSLLRISVLLLCLGVQSMLGATLYSTGSADGMAGRDWYSGSYTWVDVTSPTVQAYHNGDRDARWSYRGVVIFDIQSLFGQTLAPNSASYNFYSFGFSGVSLQYAAAGGPDVTTAYAQATGAPLMSPDGQEGWNSVDITEALQASIDGSQQYVALIFNATVNYGSGSIAASEDSEGRGSFIDIADGDGAAVPEPSTMALLGLGGVALACCRRRVR